MGQNKSLQYIFLYLLLTDELVLAGTLTVEKKSNLLVNGATWVSVCSGRFSGVFTVTSSLKMFGLCTRRKRGKCRMCQVAWLLTIPLIKCNLWVSNPFVINKLTEYSCPQRENPPSKRTTLIVHFAFCWHLNVSIQLRDTALFGVRSEMFTRCLHGTAGWPVKL